MKLLLLWEIVMVFSSCRPIQFVISSLTLGARVQFSLKLMWTQLFSKYSHQNSGTVLLSRYLVSTLYSDTRWYLDSWITQCLNTTLFRAAASDQCLGTKCTCERSHTGIAVFTLILLTVVWTVRATNDATGAIFQLEVERSSIRDVHCSLDGHTSVHERFTSDALDLLIIAFTFAWETRYVWTFIAFECQSCQFKQKKHQ